MAARFPLSFIASVSSSYPRGLSASSATTLRWSLNGDWKPTTAAIAPAEVMVDFASGARSASSGMMLGKVVWRIGVFTQLCVACTSRSMRLSSFSASGIVPITIISASLP